MTTLPASPAQPTVSDTRFAALKAKLRELFELDKSDLDFGIYRIMAAKNTEVTAFLDRQLKDVVRQTLAEHGAGATDAIDAQIAAARKAAQDAGFSPDESPKVKELEALRASAPGSSSAELEADIYNHLLNFFSRYYDEGDFISQRRYKGDTYAIPYSGEEVTLHWANKDQYYIKSGEWHKDYRFKLPDGRRVRFALVDATQETGNNKEPDEAKRRYILVDDQPVVAEGDTLTLRFHFKAPNEAEKARADDDAVAIFGGKYEKTTKGDERERFCADAEKRAIPNIPEAWAKAVLAESATEAKPKRTLLGKHLDAFTARNTFDYFIHKDLGGFLRRELDFYIKNEVVRLDDLDAAPAEHLQRVQGRVRAIRRVASKVIELLESLENFQKKLWLKKKFVLNTSWLVTVDRVPERLRDTVAENAEQWAEWDRLGFKPEGDAGGLFGGAEWGTRAYLDACDKLVVDTRLFDEAFTAELLASEEVLKGGSDFEDATTGVIVNGENFQSLGLLSKRYREQVGCVYIDPPYNTGNDGFAYKDAYQHSSWTSMVADRVSASRELLSNSSVVFVSIDDGEQGLLRQALDGTMGLGNFIANIIWQKKYAPQNDAQWLSDDHDFILAYSLDKSRWFPDKLPRTHAQDQAYSNPDNDPRGPWKGGDYTCGKTADERPNLYYAIIHPGTGEEVWPSRTRVWAYSHDEHIRHVKENRISWGSTGKAKVPAFKRFLADMSGRVPQTFWPYEEVGHNQDAFRELSALLPASGFASPKPSSLIRRVVQISGSGIVLDYFAGSGTTGHAVMSQNRGDSGRRVFLLIELGDYFNTVTRPRITKVIFSSDWKNGVAQSHDQGLSALVKCFAVESYDDALNNLPAPTGGMFDGRPAEEADALIRYALDLEMGPHLLDLDIFRDPWGHAINAQLAGDDEIKRHRVDLVETFNYLIGLRVHRYGPIERFNADFEEAPHEDGLGRIRVVRTPGTRGGLRKDPNGPFVFQRIEGEINDTNTTRVLVVWRKLTDNPEQDAAVLEAWMSRHRESTTERTEHREYQQIYINGPVTLPQPTQEIRTVLPLEETFKARMFEDTDGVA